MFIPKYNYNDNLMIRQRMTKKNGTVTNLFLNKCHICKSVHIPEADSATQLCRMILDSASSRQKPR